jgi:peroxiredoxin
MSIGKQHKLLAAGERVADFRLPLLDGGEATLRDIVAKGPALLAFFKVSCPVCQMTLPFLNRLRPGSLPVYTVSQNNTRDTRQFNERFGIQLPTLLDSDKQGFPVSNAFGISYVPTMFLIETDGTISQAVEGWRKSDVARFGELAGIQVIGPGDSVPEAKAG